MLLEQVRLVSFGKFKNKVLNLKDGFNLIYGKNESGKTTIHKFIEGMFFGFFKPYSKRRNYTDDYEKYFPWTNNEYKGILKYIYKTNTYRIERNFAKGFDDVKIFDDQTGENITSSFEYNPVTRLYSPCSTIFGFNKILYDNTISIKQLSSKTDEMLAKEFKDTLVNVGNSLDEDISVKNCINKLNRKIEDIGTRGRKKTSPYGKIVEQIQLLYKEKDKSLRYLSEIKKYENEIKLFKSEIFKLENKKKESNKVLRSIEIYEINKIYKQAYRLNHEINNLVEKSKYLQKYSIYNSNDYTKVYDMNKNLDLLNNSEKDWNNELNNITYELDCIQSKLNSMQKFKLSNDDMEVFLDRCKQIINKKDRLDKIRNDIKNVENLSKTKKSIFSKDLMNDVCLYEEKEKQKNEIIYNQNSDNMNFLSARLNENNKQLNKFKFLNILVVMIILFFVLFGIENIKFLYISIPFIGILVYLMYYEKDIKKYTKKINNQMEEVQQKECHKKDEVNKIEKQLSNILKKYNCSSKENLKDIWKNNFKENIEVEGKLKQLRNLKEEQLKLSYDIKKSLSLISEYLSLFNMKLDLCFDEVKSLEKGYHEYLNLKDNERFLSNKQKKYNQKLQDILNKKETIQIEIKNLFNKNKVICLEQFKVGLDNKRKYYNILNEIENKKILFKSVLDNKTLAGLKEEILESKNTYQKLENIQLDKQCINDKIKNIDSEMSKIKLEVTRKEEKIKNLSTNSKPLLEIEEEIKSKNIIRQKYEDKLKSLELARKTIEKISKNIQRDFAPILNKKVSEIVKNITDNKYNEIKISDKMDIGVIEPSNAKLVDVNKLSGGTIDQIYFATRFGIVDFMKKQNICLILDDCFVQYDKDRLRNILKFLGLESKRRQIIFFTCHIREKEILKDLHIPFNYLTL